VSRATHRFGLSINMRSNAVPQLAGTIPTLVDYNWLESELPRVVVLSRRSWR
jgi:hypothetical protein